MLLYFIDVLPLHRDTFTVPIGKVKIKPGIYHRLIWLGTFSNVFIWYSPIGVHSCKQSIRRFDGKYDPYELSSRALKIWTKGCSSGRRLNLVCVL